MNDQVNKQAEANQKAEQAFMDYLMWSLAHEEDPHTQYDDPIAVFRGETQQDDVA